MPGLRCRSEVVVYIDIQAAMRDGIAFYLSENGVILTRGEDEKGVLPAKYISEIANLEQRKVRWKPGFEFPLKV